MDLNEIAFGVAQQTVGQSIAQDGKNPAAVALGRLGGLKGGKARARTLTAEKKSEIAKVAAQARWSREKQ